MAGSVPGDPGWGLKNEPIALQFKVSELVCSDPIRMPASEHPMVNRADGFIHGKGPIVSKVSKVCGTGFFGRSMACACSKAWYVSAHQVPRHVPSWRVHQQTFRVLSIRQFDSSVRPSDFVSDQPIGSCEIHVLSLFAVTAVRVASYGTCDALWLGAALKYDSNESLWESLRLVSHSASRMAPFQPSRGR